MAQPPEVPADVLAAKREVEYRIRCIDECFQLTSVPIRRAAAVEALRLLTATVEQLVKVTTDKL